MGGKLDKLSLALADKVSLGEKKTLSSTAANKPIAVGSDRKDNAVFVDVFERLTVVFDRHGSVTHSYINGAIVLKSFLTGSPEMRLGLNEGLCIASLGVNGAGVSDGRPLLTIDDVALHECVRFQVFPPARSPPRCSFLAHGGNMDSAR